MSETDVKRTADGQFEKGYSANPSTQFKPGNNANPRGRHGALSDLFKELADTEKSDGKTRKERIINKVLSMAENGSLKAVEIYMNRVEGKPREYIEQRIVKDEMIVE
tara:strand:+ start:132 stop:452 length:321 start_codon:yes stop_codon:yes gene_type:complete